MNTEREKLLAAYVDGELNRENREWVEGLLTKDREADHFVSVLARSNKLLQDAYNPVFHQPLPEKLLPLRKKGWISPLGRPLSLMAAASFATAIFIGGYLASEANTRQELATIHQKLAELRQHTLEYSPSGIPVSWQDTGKQTNITIEPLKTYRTSDNRYCRKYREVVEDINGDTEVRVGIACRRGKSQWDVRNGADDQVPGTETRKGTGNPKVML